MEERTRPVRWIVVADFVAGTNSTRWYYFEEAVEHAKYLLTIKPIRLSIYSEEYDENTIIP